jgi:hypothetical protein
MLTVLVSGDLLAASRVEGEARRVGVAFHTVSSAEAAVDFCSREPVGLVVVDLAISGLDLPTLVNKLGRTEEIKPTLVAFGPHVHEARLEAAANAGFDQVLSRGQFMAQIGAILARHSSEEQQKD